MAQITQQIFKIRQVSLNRVEGQQAYVSRSAALTQLRDRLNELHKWRAALDTELNAPIEKLEF